MRHRACYFKKHRFKELQFSLNQMTATHVDIDHKNGYSFHIIFGKNG